MQNRFLRKASSLLTTGALTLGFMGASARAARAQTPANDSAQKVTQTAVENPLAGHTYWSHPDYDGVLDVWNCPERGVCAVVHSINANDPKVRKAAAKLVKKNVSDVTDADVMKEFCGYEAQFSDMKQLEPGHWQGKIWIASHHSFFGVDLKPSDDAHTLYLRGYLLGIMHYLFLGDPFHVLGKTNALTRVAEPPPACPAPPRTTLKTSP
jgi:hypothetical protein